MKLGTLQAAFVNIIVHDSIDILVQKFGMFYVFYTWADLHSAIYISVDRARKILHIICEHGLALL